MLGAASHASRSSFVARGAGGDREHVHAMGGIDGVGRQSRRADPGEGGQRTNNIVGVEVRYAIAAVKHRVANTIPAPQGKLALTAGGAALQSGEAFAIPVGQVG